MDIYFTPFVVILKLLISQVKKHREFKLLSEDLASTMEVLVPFVKEIDTLLKSLGRGSEDLRSLRKTMRRAEKMLDKCSGVGKWDLLEKNSYTKEIKEIIAEFEKFYRRYSSLIQLRKKLRSRSRKSLNKVKKSNVSTGRASLDEDAKFAEAVQESLYMQESPPGIEDVHRVILEYLAEEGKGKQVQADEQLAAALNMVELSSREADQRLLRQREDKGKGKQVQADAQVAAALNMVELSSREADQKLLRQRGDKGKGKQVQADERVAAYHQENLNMEELLLRQAFKESMISLSQQEKQVARSRAKESDLDEQIAKAWQYDESKRITTNGSSSSTGAPSDDNDVHAQKVIWESFKK